MFDKFNFVMYIFIETNKENKMSIKIIVGQVAAGDDFFNRKNEINILWQRIISGSNIILSAPRRVGKTSLVCSIRDNPRPAFHVIYMITESVNDENEFFKKIYKQVVSELKTAKRFASLLKNCTKETLGRIEKISLSEVSVQINAAPVNYYDEFTALIKSLDCSEEKILLIIDEFAQTIMNIRNDQGDLPAVHFLENNRTLRQMPEIKAKVQFVFAGSIGLENIVGAMNASQTINDLNTVQIGPFTPRDAGDLVRALAKRPGLVFGDEHIEYLLKKVEWLIPFYIQLIMQELDAMTIDMQGEKPITNALIDLAFTRIIEYRNCFESWHTRLRAAYKKDEYNFAKEILNLIAENGTVASCAIIDCAAKHSLEDSYKDIVNALKHDGYINNSRTREHTVSIHRSLKHGGSQMSQTNLIANTYNPHNQTEDELIEGFVVRKKEFQALYGDIKNDAMKHPPQHAIIHGRRGSGKTTFLLRLYYEIKRDTSINKWLLPLIFNEEQYSVRTLYKLWESVAKGLENEYEEFSGLPDVMEAESEKDNYEEICFELLKSALQKRKKKLLLLIDNFGVMLQKFDEHEQHRLREILITSIDIKIIGASAVALNPPSITPSPSLNSSKLLNYLDCQRTKPLHSFAH